MVVPLFSVYSKKSVGIGEFDDIKLIVDWLELTGNSIVQFLPLNKLGATFCPYDSISSFALEPAYISLRLIPGAEKRTIKDRIKELNKKFPLGIYPLDYRIERQKVMLLWDIYMEGSDRDSAEFKRFIQENSYWLSDFALFSTLKDYHAGRPWYEWQDNYKNRDKASLEAFSKEHEREIAFRMWMQWHLYKQFLDSRNYAQRKNILLKGDLPILVSLDSADVWSHPEFFKLGFATGAPADMYCAKGQRWGMPPYNWEKIKEDGYTYLKEKLKYAQNFYDILRIDHVVGLFRIWSIPYNEPLENQGLNGFFDPRDENKWQDQGKELLSVMLNSTDMLLCAEDLGMIPKSCTITLKELGIPGNDVQRWVKDWKKKHDFLEPSEYRLLSVAMLSTHDTTNWAAWWENEAGTVDEGLFIRRCRERGINYSQVKDKLFDANKSRHNRLRWLEEVSSVSDLIHILGKRKEELLDFIEMYENSYGEKEKLWRRLKIDGPMQEKANADIISRAFRLTLESNSVFCIELIIDLLILGGILKADPYDYRINTPGTINDKNWRFVMPIALEDLIRHPVTKIIRSLVVSSSRI